MTEAFNAYFSVAIDEHDDFAILFDLPQLEHKTIAYLRYGQVGTRKAYELRVKGRGTLEIKERNVHYHKNGNYFATVESDAYFIVLFQDRHYSFVLQYRMLNTVSTSTLTGSCRCGRPRVSLHHAPLRSRQHRGHMHFCGHQE